MNGNWKDYMYRSGWGIIFYQLIRQEDNRYNWVYVHFTLKSISSLEMHMKQAHIKNLKSLRIGTVRLCKQCIPWSDTTENGTNLGEQGIWKFGKHFKDNRTCVTHWRLRSAYSFVESDQFFTDSMSFYASRLFKVVLRVYANNWGDLGESAKRRNLTKSIGTSYSRSWYKSFVQKS